MDNDAISDLQNDVSSNNGKYSFWSTGNFYNVYNGFSTTINLPSSPDYLIIVEDKTFGVMYDLPHGSRTSSSIFRYRLSGTLLTIYVSTSMQIINGDVNIYVYIWYK